MMCYGGGYDAMNDVQLLFMASLYLLQTYFLVQYRSTFVGRPACGSLWAVPLDARSVMAETKDLPTPTGWTVAAAG